MRPTPLAAKFGGSLMWSALAAIATQGFTLATNWIAANQLTRDDMGRFAVAMTTVVSASTIGQLALGLTINRYVAEFRVNEPARANRVLGVGSAVAIASAVLCGGVAYALAPSLAVFLRDSSMTTPLRVAALLLMAHLLGGVQIGVLSSVQRFDLTAMVAFASAAVALPAVWWACRSFGLLGAVSAAAAAQLLRSVALWAVARYAIRQAGLRFDLSQPHSEAPLLIHFALPASLSGLTAPPAIWFANSTLARLPGGFGEAGSFAVAATFQTAAMFVPNLTSRLSATLLSEQRGLRSARGERDVFLLSAVCGAAALAFVAVAIALFAGPLLSLFGKAYPETARNALLVLLLASVPEFLTITLDQFVQLEGKMWQALLFVNLPRDLTLSLTCLPMAASAGAMGLAGAYLLARLVGFAGVLWLSRANLAQLWRRTA
ncbi:MAG: oligosaccharide flippase family protein [Bryobacteraceae bacterium]|nr:oligosaccharide flippase family protein [Bryobacteraceae bacterium]